MIDCCGRIYYDYGNEGKRGRTRNYEEDIFGGGMLLGNATVSGRGRGRDEDRSGIRQRQDGQADLSRGQEPNDGVRRDRESGLRRTGAADRAIGAAISRSDRSLRRQQAGRRRRRAIPHGDIFRERRG